MGALIEHGADVNVVNDRGESVLHYAVHLGRNDLVNLILRARPKLELKVNPLSFSLHEFVNVFF